MIFLQLIGFSLDKDIHIIEEKKCSPGARIYTVFFLPTVPRGGTLGLQMDFFS